MKILKQFTKVDKWLEDELPAIASYCIQHKCNDCKFSNPREVACRLVPLIQTLTGLTYAEILPPSFWNIKPIDKIPVGIDALESLPIKDRKDLIKIVRDEKWLQSATLYSQLQSATLYSQGGLLE